MPGIGLAATITTQLLSVSSSTRPLNYSDPSWCQLNSFQPTVCCEAFRSHSLIPSYLNWTELDLVRWPVQMRWDEMRYATWTRLCATWQLLVDARVFGDWVGCYIWYSHVPNAISRHSSVVLFTPRAVCFVNVFSSLIFFYIFWSKFSPRNLRIYYYYNRFTDHWILSGWAGTRRNIHPLTSVMVVNHLLSAFSIYYNPWHPPCSIYVPDSLFAQSVSKFSLVYLLAWHPPLHTPNISSPNLCLLFTAHARTIATCFAVVPWLIMSSNPSLFL